MSCVVNVGIIVCYPYHSVCRNVIRYICYIFHTVCTYFLVFVAAPLEGVFCDRSPSEQSNGNWSNIRCLVARRASGESQPQKIFCDSCKKSFHQHTNEEHRLVLTSAQYFIILLRGVDSCFS